MSACERSILKVQVEQTQFGSGIRLQQWMLKNASTECSLSEVFQVGGGSPPSRHFREGASGNRHITSVIKRRTHRIV